MASCPVKQGAALGHDRAVTERIVERDAGKPLAAPVETPNGRPGKPSRKPNPETCSRAGNPDGRPQP